MRSDWSDCPTRRTQHSRRGARSRNQVRIAEEGFAYSSPCRIRTADAGESVRVPSRGRSLRDHPQRRERQKCQEVRRPSCRSAGDVPSTEGDEHHDRDVLPAVAPHESDHEQPREA